MTHSDASYPKKYRPPAWRRRQATSLVFWVHNHVHGLCGCTGRLGRAKFDRTRDKHMAYRTNREKKNKHRQWRVSAGCSTAGEGKREEKNGKKR